MESFSPCIVPVLLVPKKGEYWRMCVACREINNITIRYTLNSLIHDLLDDIMEATMFSKMDLCSVYNNGRMKESDRCKSKTAFKTSRSLYQWLVMPFGLTNDPSSFMKLMNNVLKLHINKF